MEATTTLRKRVEKLKQEAKIDRTSAACAMEWSIDLEKGLRSKKPGQPFEALVQTMQRLELWDKGPAVNKAQSDMFKLIPGEDGLFANSMLLRLLDAFSSGDMDVKLFVVKVFLSLWRNRRRRYRKSDGILLKCSLENRLELLRRVKVVFDAGGVEPKALALVLFGCLADVANDNADIRYLVLLSLVSGEMLQVEAALFAGGCFSELSNDFASIFLEILVNMVTLSDASATVRVAAARAFAKIGCSSSNACKAYKAGLKLVLDSTEEVFLIAMLISLSQLVLRSSRLIPEQVILLSSFLTQEKSLGLRAVALKCLHFVAVRGGMCHFPAHPLFIRALVDMSDESESPPALQCGALQLLRKVVIHNPSNILEFPELFKILQTVALSPIMAKRHIAIRFLVDTLDELLSSNEKAWGGLDFIMLASKAISFIWDEVGLLVELVLDLHKFDLEMEQKIKTFLSLPFVLLESCPHLGTMVLERICLLIDNMVNKHGEAVEMLKGDLTVGHKIKEFTIQDDKFIKTKFLICVSKIVNSILENLSEAGIISKEVLDRIELVVEQVHKSSSLDCFTRVAFSFLLRSYISNCCVSIESEKNDSIDGNSSIAIQNCLIENKRFSHDCAEVVLATKDNWSAYKLGRYAACQGSWSTAAFLFEHLMGTIKSDRYNMWFRSLFNFAHSESILQLLKLPEGCANSLSRPEIKIRNIEEACNFLRSSKETMAAFSESGCPVFFSRWFLDLRAKVLECVIDTLKLWPLPLSEGKADSGGQAEDISFASLACALVQISSLFSRLAREFDMIATSFMGMDKKSLEIISGNALRCSLLAFTTGFSLFFPHLQNESSTKMSEDYLQGMLIQDLAWRLPQRDYTISGKLGFLLKLCKRPKSSLLHCRSRMDSNSFDTIGLLAACNHAVSRVVLLQNEADGVRNNHKNLILVSEQGLQLLLDIISKCMLIPFRAPSHFFRVRPCILSELIVSNSDTGFCSRGITVLQGSQLSLDLCLQLKNVPMGLQILSIELFCFLYCKASFQVSPDIGAKTSVHIHVGYKDWDSDDMVYANEQLFGYVRGSTREATNDGVIKTFVRFEPNEKGQGFSSCLLDVSGLPTGSYRTQWLSCCVNGEGCYWSLFPLNAGPIFTILGSDGDCHYGRVYSRRTKN